MNRRTVLTAPAAIATSTALPAVALGATISTNIDYDAIRARIALVCETFSRATVAFPDPMPASEAQDAMALSDQQIEEMHAVCAFAERWGVNLDWLMLGCERALIHAARYGNERRDPEHRWPQPEKVEDPAVIAYRAFRQLNDEAHPHLEAYCSILPSDPDEPRLYALVDEYRLQEYDALERLAKVQATSPAGLRAQLICALHMLTIDVPDEFSEKAEDYPLPPFGREGCNLPGALLYSLHRGLTALDEA